MLRATETLLMFPSAAPSSCPTLCEAETWEPAGCDHPPDSGPTPQAAVPAGEARWTQHPEFSLSDWVTWSISPLSLTLGLALGKMLPQRVGVGFKEDNDVTHSNITEGKSLLVLQSAFYWLSHLDPPQVSVPPM